PLCGEGQPTLSAASVPRRAAAATRSRRTTTADYNSSRSKIWEPARRGMLMEMDMIHSAGNALLIILDPIRMAYLFGGVCMGLALGILPGIGGVAGLALLLPFTYNIDAPAAFALLLGMGSTTTTADPISAILFGAPGHAASAATTLDGYPMTRAGRGRPSPRCL